MQFTPRQRPASRASRALLAAIGVGLLLGFAGPFGSYPAYPAATRYAFWLGLTMAGVAAAIAADAILPRMRFRSGAIRNGVLALLSALPMTFVVVWTLSLLQPGRVFGPQQLPLLFACVAVVQLLIVLAMKIAAPPAESEVASARAPVASPPAPKATPPALPDALTSRLPPDLGRDVVALETEDHYLRVHTAAGSALILMRMADAVALLDPALGAQVHRRWWVADAAVLGMRADGQKLVLELTGARLVPVGRTFAAAARARFAHARNPRTPASAR